MEDKSPKVFLHELIHLSRCVPLVGLDVVLVVLATDLVFWLRVDGVIPSENWLVFTQRLPLLVAVWANAVSTWPQSPCP